MHQPIFADVVWSHWKALLWTANAAWWASELWIFARDRRRVSGVNADRFSRATILAAIAVSVALANVCAARFPAARLANGDIGAVRFTAGIALMWLGIGLRQWAVATLGRLFRTSVVVQDDHRLITHGLYRRIRNPSYTGVLITVLGQGLIMGNWLSLLVLVGGVTASLAWRMHVEAEALRGRFGEAYDAYVRTSWAIVPWLW